MTKLIDRSSEKLALAKELGLNGYVSEKETVVRRNQEALERKKVIDELTSMKFRPITITEIRSMMPKWKWQWRWMGGLDAPSFAMMLVLSTMVTVFIAAVIGGISHEIKNQTMENFAVLFLCCSPLTPVIVLAIRAIRIVEVHSMGINQWRDELPYGALLAVKEAKERGVVGNFRESLNNLWFVSNEQLQNYQERISKEPGHYTIYYPAFEMDRIKADPVITGLYKGVEVEIFSWDDGKVYE